MLVLTSSSGSTTTPAKRDGDSVRRLNNAEPTAILSNQSPRHCRTHSARNAFASLRSHIPRRSLDGRRHSLSDLLHHPSTWNAPASERGRQKGARILVDMTDVASRVPLPSSPIDVVRECAPNLTLNLSPGGFFTNPAMHVSDVPYGGLAENCSEDGLAAFVPRRALKDDFDHNVKQPFDSVLMLDEQPVAEAREPLSVKLKQNTRSPLSDIPTSCHSPLPGTNQAMEFDEHDLHVAAIKEPESIELARRFISSSQSLDALASSPVQPSQRTSPKPTTVVDSEQPVSHGGGTLQTANPCEEVFKKTPNNGTPSPDRSVALVIRTKQKDVRGHDETTASSALGAASLRRPSHDIGISKAHNKSELTVKLLRERTDEVGPFLDRFAELFDPTRSSKQSSSAGSDEEVWSSDVYGVGIALSNNQRASDHARQPQAYSSPYQGCSQLFDVDSPNHSLSIEPDHISDVDSSNISVLHSAGTTYEPGSVWLNSSFSVGIDDSDGIHNHLMLLSSADQSDQDSSVEAHDDVEGDDSSPYHD